MADSSGSPHLFETPSEKAAREQTEEKRRENLQRKIQLWFNGFLLISNIVMAGAIIHQGFLMNDQLSEIKGTSWMNYHQTINAGVQAKAANSFAGSATSINGGIATAVKKLNLQASELEQSVKQATRLADDAEKADRPWIGIGGINIEQVPTTDSAMRVSIPVWNGGHSPGLHVQALVKLELHSSDEMVANNSPIAECNKPKPVWTDTMMGGSIVLPNMNSLTIFLDGPVVSEPDLGCLLNSGSICPKLFDLSSKYNYKNLPRMGIYAAGCIDYFDESHVAHRTFVREAYWPKEKPGGTFYFCPNGNDAD